MDCRLHEAALTGNVTALLDLLQEDALLLERNNAAVEVEETPLHIAATFGYVDFARVLLSRKPELAREFNPQGLLPMHLASAKGHVDMVQELLKKDSSICFVRDRGGSTPLHIAAMKGRVSVLNELLCARPTAARVLTGRGETILHLCVNCNRFEALKLLVEWIHDDEFVNFRDENDNTVLHLSAALKQIQIVNYLLSNTRVEVNALNTNNFTALDLLIQCSCASNDIEELKETLQSAGARSAQNMSLVPCDQMPIDNPTIQSVMPLSSSWKKPQQPSDWIDQSRDTVMVVAILIATITFEAGLDPPGGVWQDSGNYNGTEYKAGEAIMGYLDPVNFYNFTIFNLIGFMASLSIILLLISGLPIHQRVFMWVFRVIMWIAASTMVVTYGNSFRVLASDDTIDHLKWLNFQKSLAGFISLVALMFVGHVFPFIVRILRKLGILPRGYTPTRAGFRIQIC